VTDFLTGAGGQVLLLFGLVVLVVVTLAAAWEASRRWQRQRAVSQKLEELQRGRVAAAEAATDFELLRREEGESSVILERMVLFLPRRQDIRLLLEQADVSWTAGTFMVLTLGLGAAGALTAAVAAGNLWTALVAGLATASLPLLHVRRKKAKRIRAFEEHFADAIDLMSRALRAGHAFTTGIRAIADEAPEPVAGEFERVFEEQRYGLPLRESLLALGDRIGTVDVQMFVTSVLIQRETGGNLAENLDNLGDVIRQRFKFERELRTKTAQGRATGYILAAAPLVAGLGMYMLNPEYIRPLWEEQLGLYMMAAAGSLQLFGFLVIRRIVDIDF